MNIRRILPKSARNSAIGRCSPKSPSTCGPMTIPVSSSPTHISVPHATGCHCDLIVRIGRLAFCSDDVLGNATTVQAWVQMAFSAGVAAKTSFGRETQRSVVNEGSRRGIDLLKAKIGHRED